MDQPRFVTRDAFAVVGVDDNASKIDEVDPGFYDLWMNRFMAHEPDVRAQSRDDVCYGVWFGAPGTDISNGRYAVFDSTLDLIGESTGQALDSRLPASNYAYDGGKPRLDYMGPDTSGPDSPVSVWIPVVPRTR